MDDAMDGVPITPNGAVLDSGDAANSSTARCSESPQEEWTVKAVESAAVVTEIPVVTMTDLCEVSSHDGTFPFSRERLGEKRRWKFEEWYPRFGLACSLNTLFHIQDSSNRTAAATLPEEIASAGVEEGTAALCNEDLFEAERCNGVQLDDLPDHVLVHIFQFLHPIDRVHSASPVCKRWNRLSKSRKLWREVRIVISDQPCRRESVANFLRQAGRYIQKICICMSCWRPMIEQGFVELFPPVMPSVTVLDIGFFPNLTIPVLNFFMECFPSLERLNMEGLLEVDEDALGILCSRGFPKLKELILSDCVDLSAVDYETLCSVKRPLEVLSVDGIPGLRNSAAVCLATAQFALSLKRLYLEGERIDDNGFRAITCCRNLTLLSVSYCETCTDLALGYIKLLSKLEHLHLCNGVEFTDEGFEKLFKRNSNGSDSEPEFPSLLRFLNLGGCFDVGDVIVSSITQNCPKLRSLCLAWCFSVTDVGFTMIVQRLHDLEFLDICGVDRTEGAALLDVPDLYLKKLRYLGAKQCLKIKGSTLQSLNLRKEELIVKNCNNRFITFCRSNGNAVFGEGYDVTFRDVVDDELSRYDGFCCMWDL